MSAHFSIPTGAALDAAAKAAFTSPSSARRLMLRCSDCRQAVGEVRTLPNGALVARLAPSGYELLPAETRAMIAEMGEDDLPARSARPDPSYQQLSTAAPVPGQPPPPPVVLHCRCSHDRRSLDHAQLVRRSRAKAGTYWLRVSELPKL